MGNASGTTSLPYVLERAGRNPHADSPLNILALGKDPAPEHEDFTEQRDAHIARTLADVNISFRGDLHAIGPDRCDVMSQFVEIDENAPIRQAPIRRDSELQQTMFLGLHYVQDRNEMLHHAVDHTPYEGMQVRGWPVVTISRGEIVYSDGHVNSSAGRGRFLPCARPFPPRRDSAANLAR